MTKNLTKRYLSSFIQADVKEKMVFLSGPRQVGKTTLALGLLGGDETHAAYFNWDYPKDQKRLINLEFPPQKKLIVLDEIHKYKKWRNWLKGLYDKTKSKRSYLITGSARLDYYRRGGDALTGRYHRYHLHPLSLAEVDPKASVQSLEHLFAMGGFPEPFYASSQLKLRRWQQERSEQILHEDLRDLEKVEDVFSIGQLMDHLPQLIGSPLSINSLKGDLQVAHQTVAKWLTILERLFVLFRIAPFGSSKIRAVKKEQKVYLWDYSVIQDKGARFENMVASHLLKYCDFIRDTQGYRMELRYIRDTDKREVDFVVIKNNKPLFAVECKLAQTSLPASLAYFSKRLQVPRYYLVHMGQKDYEHATLPIRVLPFHRFVTEMNLP